MICAAYVEDFKIYFLVAVVKPKMTRNVMMTSFQATNFLNLLVACDKKVLEQVLHTVGCSYFCASPFSFYHDF